MGDDLELKDLGMFYGTEKYYELTPFTKTIGTEGIEYIMNNGYSWFVTDTIIKAEDIMRKMTESEKEFIVFKLKLKPQNQAIVTIEDGNGKEFYRKIYKYTNAKKDLMLFLENDVLMLSIER